MVCWRLGDAVRRRELMFAFSRRLALFVIWFGVAAQAGAADQGLPPEKACAAYDVHLVTLIEDHGRAQEIRPEKIHEAMATVLQARTACRAGDFDEAHRLYSFLNLGRTSVAPNHWVVLR
jgi:hypothetical protein